ncbi:MAG: DUF6265 family protein [Chitinophagaceae bacterium]
MKKVVLFGSILFVVVIAHSQSSSQKTKDDFIKLNWLEGDWTRLDVKPGRTAHESWQKISASEWQGIGVNMKGTDTAFAEKLKLVIKENNIYYVADLAENKEPVYFKLTTITDHSFVCENPQHDFPKKIAYQKNGNKIKATISGDGKSFDYLFERSR